MAAGQTCSSSLRILAFLLITATTIRENTDNVIISRSMQVGSVFQTDLATELVPNSTTYRRSKSRVKRFTSCRIQYTTKGTASFNLERKLLVCGDISSNPGPKGIKVPPKYPCGECDKAVRNNQDAILCSTCFNWFHVK